jgi:hypothetical protein
VVANLNGPLEDGTFVTYVFSSERRTLSARSLPSEGRMELAVVVVVVIVASALIPSDVKIRFYH